MSGAVIDVSWTYALPLGAPVDDVIDVLARRLPAGARLSLVTYVPVLSVREVPAADAEPEVDVRRSLRHVGYRWSPGKVPAGEWKEHIRPAPGGEVVGLDARVFLGRRCVGRLPLLDFVVPPSPLALRAVRAAGLALTGGPGVVLESGRSYHWYGGCLLPLSAWRDFMARALLLDRLVDARWVGHCLIESSACLRITAGGHKATVPCVAATVD